MKIAFIHLGVENIGIEYLSAVLKKGGHQTRLFMEPGLFNDKFIFSNSLLGNIFSIKRQLLNSIERYNADLFCFSVVTDSYLWALDMAGEIRKKSNTPVLFGGIHVTSLPEKVIARPEVDLINIGEGFESIVELVDKMERREDICSVKNIWCKKDGKIIKNELREPLRDINKLPLPDKSLFSRYIDHSSIYSIMSAFGCPYRCTYCSNHLKIDAYKEYKCNLTIQRSPESIIEELKKAQKLYKTRYIKFYDDLFTIDPAWVKKFTKLYKENIGIPYRIITHPNHLNYDVVKCLKESNCIRVQIGIQSISEEVRKNVLGRYETNEQIKSGIALLRKFRLRYMTDLLLGIPGEDISVQKEAAEFFIQYKPDRISTFWLTYYPRTLITNIALNKGIITRQNIENIENGIVGNLHKGQSSRDMKTHRKLDNHAVFYLLVPLFPRWLLRTIYYSPVFGKLHLLPRGLRILLDLIGGILHNDMDTLSYVYHYIRTFYRVLGIKLGLERI